MDALQDRLVRVGLNILAEYGFVLAGGYALQAHQLVDRMSEDVDLFTDRWDSNEFGRAVEAVLEAYRKDGLEITVIRRAETFARLNVIDPQSGKVGSVDLAADSRDRDPVRLSEGPVLAERDAVASKVATVFSRGEARDYLDLAGILQSGRFSREELMDLAASVEAGFSKGWFAEALAGVDRFPNEEFAAYEVDVDRIARVRETMRDWSRQLHGEITGVEATLESGGRRPQIPPMTDVPEGEQRRAARRDLFRSSDPRSDLGETGPSREGPGIDL